MMSVTVPEFKLTVRGGAAGAPYGYVYTSGELDRAVSLLSDMAEDFARLATLEKTAQLLAQEIERTRRRVNALEYIMIPRYESAIKTISMKLDENERGNTTRLMKVKPRGAPPRSPRGCCAPPSNRAVAKAKKKAEKHKRRLFADARGKKQRERHFAFHAVFYVKILS